MKRDRRPLRVKQQQILRLLVRDGDCCHWCGVRFSSAHQVTLEHLIPRHYGGSHADENVVLAGAECNAARHHIVVCAGCGTRVRHFRTAVWRDRRDVFHAHCAPITACPLSAREQGLLYAVADGLTNVEIGDRLRLSPLTVKSHLARIARKLGTGDRAGMVGIGFRAGWLR